MFPPTRAVSALVAENKILTGKNDSMKVLINGVLVLGFVCLAVYIRKEYLKKADQERVRVLKI
jgi:hypothetical protein